MADVQELFSTKPLSATATLVGAAKQCALGGVFCSTVTGAPTLEVREADDTVIVAAFVLAPGTYFPLPGRSGNGLKLVLVGTAAFTAYYLP